MEDCWDSLGLLVVLAGTADPRDRLGMRHKLAGILELTVCAVLAGARSFTAIAEGPADADTETLAGLEVAWVMALGVHVPADLAAA